MLAKDFWYELPPEHIAQTPVKPRDSSKLMLLEPHDQRINHAHFYDLPNFLKPGDLLVVNDTKVFKARLKATKQNDASREYEVFLLRPENESWIALAKPGRKLSIGDILTFPENISARVENKNEDGTITLNFGLPANIIFAFADRNGTVPTPPYVKDAPADAQDYQTVYAKETGSAAAPTAGFHFTSEIIDKLQNMGVEFASVTLHVGLGTFRPMQTELVEDHVMHEEWIDVPDKTVEQIKNAKLRGGRVVAVGTTAVRALESETRHGFTKIFIKPGFIFKNIDAMITNFHLPESTLLVLVSAFAQTKLQEPDAGRKFILAAYKQAIENNYRFYSFGDAVLII